MPHPTTRLPAFLLGLITGGCLLLAGILLGGQGAAAPETIRARQLEIVDEIGTVRLVLGSNAAGGTISVRDHLGRTVLLASAADQGGTLVLGAAGSREPALVASASAEGGLLRLFDQGGTRVGELAARDGGRLALAGTAGREAIVLTSAGGVGTAAGHDANGGRTWALGQNAAGNGVVETYRGATGAALVGLSSTADHQGQIRTNAPNGRSLVLLTASPNREGQLYTYDDLGRPLCAIATRSNGPTIRIFGPEGAPAITLETDAEGSGIAGVWRPDGNGQTFTPPPGPEPAP